MINEARVEGVFYQKLLFKDENDESKEFHRLRVYSGILGRIISWFYGKKAEKVLLKLNGKDIEGSLNIGSILKRELKVTKSDPNFKKMYRFIVAKNEAEKVEALKRGESILVPTVENLIKRIKEFKEDYDRDEQARNQPASPPKPEPQTQPQPEPTPTSVKSQPVVALVQTLETVKPIPKPISTLVEDQPESEPAVLPPQPELQPTPTPSPTIQLSPQTSVHAPTLVESQPVVAEEKPPVVQAQTSETVKPEAEPISILVEGQPESEPTDTVPEPAATIPQDPVPQPSVERSPHRHLCGSRTEKEIKKEERFFRAAKVGNIKLFDELKGKMDLSIEEGIDLFENTVLKWALANGQNKMAKHIIAYGKEIGNTEHLNKQGPEKWKLNTALHLVIGKGYVFETHDGAKVTQGCSGVDIVRAIIDADGNPNLQNTRGDTPLHLACLRHDRWMIEALLNGKADTTIRNKEEKLAKDYLVGDSDVETDFYTNYDRAFGILKETVSPSLLDLDRFRDEWKACQDIFTQHEKEKAKDLPEA